MDNEKDTRTINLPSNIQVSTWTIFTTPVEIQLPIINNDQIIFIKNIGRIMIQVLQSPDDYYGVEIMPGQSASTEYKPVIHVKSSHGMSDLKVWNEVRPVDKIGSG